MPKTKHNVIRLIALATLLPLLGLGCKNADTINPALIKPVTLKYWQVFDEPSDFTEIIARFKQLHPNITIQIKKLRFDEYQNAIIRALAEGNGPDIISIQTTWLREYKDILQSAPASVAIPTAVLDGKNVVQIMQTVTLPRVQDIKNQYVETVANDVVLDNQIYGIPYSVDTLALFYNKQLLNQANIPFAPAIWTDFNTSVKKLTKQNSAGVIVQSGAALGGSRNINRAPDIVAALMMQNGTAMTSNNDTEATFHLIPQTVKSKDIYPGRDALRFYADFASPAKEVYAWNETFPESLTAFANQQTAFFFGYSYHIPLIRSLSPGLSFGIAPVPQISETGPQVNFANYWMEAVTKQSKNPKEAWAFIQFASEPQNIALFLANAHKPAALRALIADQRKDEELGAFANQLLTAKTWYHGDNVAAMEETFRRMIEQVVGGEKTPDEAIAEAAKAVNATY